MVNSSRPDTSETSIKRLAPPPTLSPARPGAEAAQVQTVLIALDRARRQSVLVLLGVAWVIALSAGLPAGAAAQATGSRSAHASPAARTAADARHRPRRGTHGNHRRRRMARRARQHAVRVRAESAAPRLPLVFGVYPGGAAGTVGPSGPVAPDDPVKRLAALEQLRSGQAPFVVHLYAGYSGPGGWSAAAQVGEDIAQYTAAGFKVELVLTYRPADGGSSVDVADFAEFVRQTLAAFGANQDFVSLQVTNEANESGAPSASDGYYAGAEDALIAGVLAARAEIRAQGFSQVKVGFNWAYDGSAAQRGFWSYLANRGGRAFVGALDWVGLDIYPGTWGPAISGPLSRGTTTALDTALSELRRTYLPLAGIPFTVPLHISESGYPTGPGRTTAMQVQALTAAVTAVQAGRSQFDISDYRWFDLRDADSASSSFQSQYGLMTDSYAPKPAFFAYRALVARFGAAA
jgi:hypothetical protein